MFYQDMYTVCATGTATTKDTSIKEGGIFTVLTGLIVEMPFQANTSNIKVSGLTLGTTAAAGVFTAAYDSTNHKTTLTFYEGDVAVGDSIRVTYERRVAHADVTTIPTTGGTSRGELTLTWAVMSPGDDCTQASISGYWHLYVPRVMVTTRASLDTSRGTAATPNIVFSAIDAHRGDGEWYELIFEETETGAYATDYTGDIIWR